MVFVVLVCKCKNLVVSLICCYDFMCVVCVIICGYICWCSRPRLAAWLVAVVFDYAVVFDDINTDRHVLVITAALMLSNDRTTTSSSPHKCPCTIARCHRRRRRCRCRLFPAAAAATVGCPSCRPRRRHRRRHCPSLHLRSVASVRRRHDCGGRRCRHRTFAYRLLHAKPTQMTIGTRRHKRRE